MLRAHFKHAYPPFELTVDLALPLQGITAVLGPSGAGKTTLLRLIAGLEKSVGGYLALADQVWQDTVRFVPPHRRNLGYVFQDARLFPHLTVRANLEYGLRRSISLTSCQTLDEVIELLALQPLLQRTPERLSGGERQRVAIARALALQPALLLLDEPLAALDHAHRQEVLPYLERMNTQVKIPMLYVSHAPDEIKRLATRSVTLTQGKVINQSPG